MKRIDYFLRNCKNGISRMIIVSTSTYSNISTKPVPYKICLIIVNVEKHLHFHFLTFFWSIIMEVPVLNQRASI